MQHGYNFILLEDLYSWRLIYLTVIMSTLSLNIYESFFQCVIYALNSWTFSYFDDLVFSTYKFISKWSYALAAWNLSIINGWYGSFDDRCSFGQREYPTIFYLLLMKVTHDLSLLWFVSSFILGDNMAFREASDHSENISPYPVWTCHYIW